jgi:hypothetical protein
MGVVDGGEPETGATGTVVTGAAGNVATSVGAAVVDGEVDTGSAGTDVVVVESIDGAAGASSIWKAGEWRVGCTVRLSTTSARIDPSPAEAMTTSERLGCRGSRWAG